LDIRTTHDTLALRIGTYNKVMKAQYLTIRYRTFAVAQPGDLSICSTSIRDGLLMNELASKCIESAEVSGTNGFGEF